MARAPSHAARAQAIARKLVRASSKQRPPLLYDAFQLAAVAGLVEPARALLALLYTTPPAAVFTALSTQAIDGFAAAAGLGDLTGGRPSPAGAPAPGTSLADRVAAGERTVRARLTGNAFAGAVPTDDAWRARPASDPWFRIDRWRRVQGLLTGAPTAAVEDDARARLREILADPTIGARTPGGADGLTLGLDLALRHGSVADVDDWLARHGAWLDEPFVIEAMLCLPALARAMVAGTLARVTGDGPALARALADVVRAASAGAATAAVSAAAPPAVQRRTVEASYSQIQLEPEARTVAEARQVYFQDRRESPQGMSLFPTMVAIATPTDVGRVDISITRADTAPALDGAVQAVSFPLEVRGPLVLRSVDDADDGPTPFTIAPGRYDVHAAFRPSGKRRRPRTGLWRLDLALTFCPAGALGAPRCYLLADGAPPSTIFAHVP